MYHQFFDTTFAYWQDLHRELHEQAHSCHLHKESPTAFKVFPITERPYSTLVLYVLRAHHGSLLGSVTI